MEADQNKNRGEVLTSQIQSSASGWPQKRNTTFISRQEYIPVLWNASPIDCLQSDPCCLVQSQLQVGCTSHSQSLMVYSQPHLIYIPAMGSSHAV